MTGGAAPDSIEAMDLAEEHRRSIETFYDCAYPMHRGLGEMYVADERFAKTYNDVAPGLRSGCGTRSTPTPTGPRPPQADAELAAAPVSRGSTCAARDEVVHLLLIRHNS